jgi:hypothetical protein
LLHTAGRLLPRVDPIGSSMSLFLSVFADRALRAEAVRMGCVGHFIAAFCISE